MSLASYTCCPEALEEDTRIARVRSFCLPERWWTPVPDVRGEFGRAVAGVPRRVSCLQLPDRKASVSRIVDERPNPLELLIRREGGEEVDE